MWNGGGQSGAGGGRSSGFIRRWRIGRRLGKHLPDVDAEGVGQPPDVHEGRVAFAPLDPADVGAVEAAFVGQRLLRPPQPLPVLPDSVAESGLKVFCF